MDARYATIQKNSDAVLQRLATTYLPLLRRYLTFKIFEILQPTPGNTYGNRTAAQIVNDPFPLPDFVLVGTSGMVVQQDPDNPELLQHQHMRCSPSFYGDAMYDTVEVNVCVIFFI
jgi:hypothetical protein